MGFVSLGKTNNENNLSKLGRYKFGEQLHFGSPSTPLQYKNISPSDLEVFQKKLKKERRNEIQKNIVIGLGLLLIIGGFIYQFIFS